MAVGVKVKGRTVRVGDIVKYIVGGKAGVRPATVVDVTDGATNKLALRIRGKVHKGVEFGAGFGHWTV